MESPWRGDGSIKKIEGKETSASYSRRALSGKWRLQWRILEDGKWKTIDKTFKTKSEAVSWRDSKKVELATGARQVRVAKKAAALITLQAMFDELTGKQANDFADGKLIQSFGATSLTVQTKWYRWNKWVKGSRIAARPVASLLRDDVYAFVREMKAEGASVPTMKDVLGVMKHVVNLAILEKPECGRMAGNPFVNIVLQTNEERALAALDRLQREHECPSVIALSPGEAKLGLESVGSLQHLTLLAVHILGGFRLGEGMAFSKSRIDFERGVYLCDRAVHLKAGGKQYVGLPKGNKIRLVALSPTLLEVLACCVAELDPGREFLFSQRKDRPLMKYQYYELWNEAVEMSGLPVSFSTQDARVTLNNWTEKLMTKVSLSTRLEHMGHSLSRNGAAPSGVAVNITNYTSHIPDAYKIFGAEIDRTVFGPHLHLEIGGAAA